jgi:hypothetical protein
MKLTLNIQDVMEGYVESLLRHLNVMQYREKAEWIRRNKLDILLMSYNIKTPYSIRAFYLWKKQMDLAFVIQELLDSNNVKYVFAKTISFLPCLHADIDVMVSEETMDKVVRLLKKNGFRLGRVLNRGYVIEFKSENVSVELHSDIEVLGLLHIGFEHVGEPLEISIDIYNQLLNRNVYWKCPDLVDAFVLKLLDILDHKVVTIADLLELEIFNSMLDVLNSFTYTRDMLRKFPKPLTINEVMLLGRTLMAYNKKIHIELNILNLVRELIYYLKVQAGVA